MSNSFNISVKPEIAAAVVKIDANKTVIDENKVILVDIEGTDLPAAVTKIDDNKTEIDAIRSTDVPNIQTNIDANETKIDANTNTLQAVHTSVEFAISVSDNLLISADTERSNLGSVNTKVKEIRIDYPGTYRFTFNTKVSGPGMGQARVFKNGVAHGAIKSFGNTEYPNIESDDLVFATGDLAQLYLVNDSPIETTFAKEFRIKGDLDIVMDPVIID